MNPELGGQSPIDEPPEGDSVRVGAYFYPLAPCQTRQRRSDRLRDDLELSEAELPDELTLAAQAKPLFDGHDQPAQYCIPWGDSQAPLVEWNDNDYRSLMTQMVLAQKYGLSYFIFDTYHGLKDGIPAEEFWRSKAMFQRLGTDYAQYVGLTGFQYARMEAMEAPRALLPIPSGAADDMYSGYGGSLQEPGRGYDVTPEAARHIVDRSIGEWRSSLYLKIGLDRPYLAILMPALDGMSWDQKQERLGKFIDELYRYSLEEAGFFPYVAGVVRRPDDAVIWSAARVDAVTAYGFLPDFYEGRPDIQDYAGLMGSRVKDWYKMQTQARGGLQDTLFLPSVSVGWDASPRGEPGYNLEDVQGVHPYTPIVTGGSAELFAKFLTQAIDFNIENIPEDQRLVTIFAWNEVTEGAALLPRLRDGIVDASYLEAVSQMVHQRAHCPLCRIMPGHYR